MTKIANNVLNSMLLRFRKRAERLSKDQLVETFVNVGLMFDVLSNEDHQIVYGRRGAGKTHAFRYLSDHVVSQGGIAIYVDLSNLGSDSSIYNNQGLSISERAVRLLTDVLSQIHDSLIEQAIEIKELDLNRLSSLVDEFSSALPKIKIVGDSEEESTSGLQAADKFLASATLAKASTLGLGIERSTQSSETTRSKETGKKRYSVSFPAIGSSVGRIADFIAPRRLWVLIDEWSSIPEDIQPFLADVLRRAFFNIQSVTVKIAAIEHRSKFFVPDDGGQYIGFELGADIASNLNLDNYLVFDNDEEQAKAFFSNLLAKHIQAIAAESGAESPTSDELISNAFTQENAFRELVRSSEGVPRDIMYIAAQAAQKANKRQISIPNVRQAARAYFQTDKLNTIQSNRILSSLLRYLIDEVIGERRTSAFLVEAGRSDPNLNRLFDRRILHVKSQNESSKDMPGTRFLVYKLDYGCYIDLIYTKKFPEDITLSDEREMDSDDSIDAMDGSEAVEVDEKVGAIGVPEDDKRSYRRAVLDLDAFYKSIGEPAGELTNSGGLPT